MIASRIRRRDVSEPGSGWGGVLNTEWSGRSLTSFCFMLDVHVNMHGVKALENQEYYNVRNVKRMFFMKIY